MNGDAAAVNRGMQKSVLHSSLIKNVDGKRSPPLPSPLPRGGGERTKQKGPQWAKKFQNSPLEIYSVLGIQCRHVTFALRQRRLQRHRRAAATTDYRASRPRQFGSRSHRV